MNLWWSQEWIQHWGPGLFHGVFWPLLAVGTWAARRPGGTSAAGGPGARLALAPLMIGIGLGVALLAAGLVALAIGQPGHVWSRLLLFGGLFAALHTALLVGLIHIRRGVAPAQTGDRP